MKKLILPMFFSLLFVFLQRQDVCAQIPATPLKQLGPKNLWTEKELISPAMLAANLKQGTEKPLIYNIGAVEDIYTATHIGAVDKAENLKKLKTAVVALPKNKALVIYCGCCPFAKCPNIRPAFSALKQLGFTNVKLLDLPVNLQTNWISKGYPLNE